ncbi:protein FAM149B1 isoform X1 [Rhinichthys klamathensis goyatoka]|uniref:protein FAM149B1 isoform X1 n=1 Tax=Rhinichthys klamathensis goyatoka TaxID=3034132 RepID=UPI0024B5E073|nr:protein FAM149B1 isoform X1 [Rhinichthys klamathensis goyatoka]
MISRYSRRPVSHSLEIRGLSRSCPDQHPLPEEADDDTGHPPRLLHDLQEDMSSYSRSEESSASSIRSGCQTLTTDDTAQSWSGIHSYTGTGISTERSSVFSWGYDEFDKAASRQVQQMFEEIEEQLYERKCETQLKGLQEECQEWASRFPHLRILGTQLVCPTDEGFQWYATPAHTPIISKAGQSKEITANELCVQGRRAVLCQPSVEVTQHVTPSCNHGDEMPRVIEAEGLIEEYLAFDCRDLDEEWERDYVNRRRRRCLPPVSPYRCRREAVLGLLFDDVWRELIGWMEELVRRHWEGFVSDDEKNAVALSPACPDTQNPFLLLSNVSSVLPPLSQSRTQQLTASLQAQSSKSWGSKHKSRRKSKKQRKSSTTNRVPVGAAVAHHNFNDLIMIHGIPLQQRNLGTLDRIAQDSEEKVSHRPGSSVIPTSKPRPRRALEQSSSSLTRPPQSARRRNPPPRTLMPLTSSVTQAITTGSMEEVVRGTRLTTASDRLASPPMPLSRNTLLPPIGTGDTDLTYSGQHSRLIQKQRGSSSRAHSAVTDEGVSLQPRDKMHLLDVFSRPNTTHTFRSDTPYRRSFTGIDNIGQGRPGRASVGIDSLGIGVTGISLGISSSSFIDSFSHHPHGHFPIEHEEEPDAKAPPPVSVPARSHNRGGTTARSSRPGL